MKRALIAVIAGLLPTLLFAQSQKKPQLSNGDLTSE
jgi:hypothetical protein